MNYLSSLSPLFSTSLALLLVLVGNEFASKEYAQLKKSIEQYQ